MSASQPHQPRSGVVNLDGAFANITETWTPKIAAELNGQHVRLARLEGEFLWHAHEHEDELFWIHSGRLRIRLREAEGERDVVLGPGDLFVVPRGVEHLPIAEPEACVVLVEPATTTHTGAVDSDRTVRDFEHV